MTVKYALGSKYWEVVEFEERRCYRMRGIIHVIRCLSEYRLTPIKYLVWFHFSRVLAHTVKLCNSHRCDLGYMLSLSMDNLHAMRRYLPSQLNGGAVKGWVLWIPEWWSVFGGVSPIVPIRLVSLTSIDITGSDSPSQVSTPVHEIVAWDSDYQSDDFHLLVVDEFVWQVTRALAPECECVILFGIVLRDAST